MLKRANTESKAIMITDQQNHYQSYLLRLWRSPHSSWHGSLQSTASGEKQTFADLPALVGFLVAQLAEEDAAGVLAEMVAQLQMYNFQSPHS